MSERGNQSVSRRGWRIQTGARLLLCALVALALWAGMQARGDVSIARASGRGPCTPLTANDLSQPQVTPRGHASAWPSRNEGTGGTLLSISGSGWPANTTVEVDGWSDNMGDMLYDDIMAKVKTTASGAFQTQQFRLDMVCPWLGWTNVKIAPVTVLFVAHTLDGTFQTVSHRAQMIFTYLPSPLFNGAQPEQATLTATHAGDTARIVSTGWTPGDHITITTLVAAWPQTPVGPYYGPPPITTPTSSGDITTTTNSSGSFSLTYHVPDAAPLSTVLLLLHTSDSRYGDVSIYPFSTFMLYPTIFPTTLLAERTSLAGGALTVTGDHWLPNQQIDIEYCRGLAYDSYHHLYCSQFASESLGAVRTDGSGHFFVQVHLPSNARLGDITVQARLDGASVIMEWDARPFAAAQPVTIVAPTVTLTYAQIHPRRVWVEAHWPYFAASALALLTLLVALGIWLMRRWRGRGKLAYSRP